MCSGALVRHPGNHSPDQGSLGWRFPKRRPFFRAADPACRAGAMYMLPDQRCTGCTPYGGFTPGTTFDWASASASAPCQYAAKNGYSGTGLVSGAQSNQVSASFPGSVPGVATPTVAMAGSSPFLQVDVTDRVKVYFSALLRGSPTQDVRARA